MLKRTLWSASLCLVSILNLPAQNLKLFPDIVIKGGSYVTEITEASDGYLISGVLDHVNGTRSGNLVKVDRSGNVITSFNQIHTNDHILKSVVLADGKILIGGWFTDVNGSAASLLRLNADGTIDATFEKFIVSLPSESVSTFAVQTSGKILVTGYFSKGKYTGLIRLNADGTIDNTFNAVSGGSFSGVKLRLDGAGNIFITSGTQLFKFAANGGTPTTGFPVTVDGHFFELEIYGDKVVIGGTFTSVGGVSRTNLAIINSNGTLDPFTAVTQGVYKLAVTNDGKIIVNNMNQVNVYNTAGVLLLQIAENSPEHIFIDKDQKILLSGDSRLTAYRMPHPFMIRFNSDFTVDNTFTCQATFTKGITAIASSGKDGRIFISTGYGFSPSGINDLNKKLVRLNLNGTVDASFNPIISSDGVRAIAIQPDGKVLVCSDRLIRLNASGSSDITFSPTIISGTSFPILSKVKLKDESIFLSGAFNTLNGKNSPGIVKLKSDGKIDATFISSLPLDSYVTDFAFQSNNKIIVTGYFYGNTVSPKIVLRLNANGTIDDSFTSGTAQSNYGAWRVALDSQDRIYVAGSFYNYKFTTRNALVRLSSQGLVDATFNPSLAPFGLNVNLEGLEIISDNEIFVGASTGYTGPSMAVFNASGGVLTKDYTSLSDQSSISTSYFNGETLYVAGRLAPADYSFISGVGYANIYPVAGSITGLQASWDSPLKSHLNWNNLVTKGTALIIQRSRGNNSSFVPIDTISSTATTYVDTTVKGSFSYYYRIKGINTHSATSYSNEALLFHLQAQTIDFKALAQKTVGDLPFSLTATASSGLAVTFSSSDLSIATVENNIVTIKKGGTITITGSQMGNNIFDSVSVKQVLIINSLPVGIEASVRHEIINAYPNPGKGLFEMNLAPSFHKGVYSIVSSNGIVRNKQSLNLTSEGIFFVDLTMYTAGLYLIRIENENGSVDLKVVKE